MTWRMPAGRLLLVTAIAFLGVQPRAMAADDPLHDYSVTTWTDKDGLPSGLIRTIVQDADGYLWLGTDVGVVRFDGVRFTHWAPLGRRSIWDLFVSRDRSLWIGLGAAGAIGRMRDGVLQTYGPQDGISPGYILSLFEDQGGTIWAGGREGLNHLRNGRWERVVPRDGLPEGPVLRVYEDSKARLWVATDTAVFRGSPGGVAFERMATVDWPENASPHFSEDSSGVIWITDFIVGFKRLDGFPSRVLPGQRGSGVQLLHDRRGNLWVATQGQGLWRVRPDGGRREAKVEVIAIPQGLASDAVRALFEDREGNIWLGTHAGLQRLSPRRLTRVTDLGMAHAVEATQDGSVWVATARGLTRFSASRRQEYGEREGLPGSIVRALHADKDGTLWLATDRGLAQFANGRFSSAALPAGIDLRRIVRMTRANDTMWLRDRDQGFFRLSRGRLSLPRELPEDYRNVITAVHGGDDDSIWVGSTDGRFGVINLGGEFSSFQSDIGDVRAIYQDPDRVVWVGGATGLSRSDKQGILTVNERNGFSGNVSAIVEDLDGVLWVGVGSGILQLEKTEFDKAAHDPDYELAYRQFDTFDGAAGGPLQLGHPSAARARDGTLWFVTGAGVTVIDPRNLGEPRLLPPVTVEAITADTRVSNPTPGRQLPARTSHLQIDFTALTFTDPMKVRFRYRLEGFDESWVDAGTSRQAAYTNLPPRDYRFRVMARNSDGVWNEPGAVWEFAIQPAFYQTNAFYAACILAVALALWASWRLRVRQVRHEYALVYAERIRMSRSIHDTLLQGLVGVALQLDDLSDCVGPSAPQVRDRLSALRRLAEDYIREARQSIWDLRSRALEAGDLPKALREIGTRITHGTVLRFHLSVRGRLRACPPKLSEQVLLIGQEALNNVVRHSQARAVHMELRFDAERLQLRVCDDGCGFDFESIQHAQGHYGLISMKERTELAGGQLTILSRPGGGTQVETVFPLPQST